MAPLTGKAYSGLARKLVLGIDVGTTYSGVSYAVLDPGEVPEIKAVTRYPGQENVAGNFKIPSIMYYRQDGTVHSVGAEAAAPGIELDAEDENLIFVEWFKLHLRPEHLDSGELKTHDLTPLPPGKTATEVLSDFLRYLFSCTRQYISETHANGQSLWNSFKDRIEYVLGHPNGWEGLQQSKMRQAAITAGLIPDSLSGHARVHFVTEGEASLHFCIQSGLTSEAVQSGQNGVMIVDAGGGTVDISSYAFKSTVPLLVEEIASAESIMQGSTRVSVRAKEYLRKVLANSAYGTEGDIKNMVDEFDRNAKLIFKGPASAYIQFGSMSCNDPRVNIRRGKMTLSGESMESFFRPSLDGIIDAVKMQRQAASHSIQTVLLVGGFAASPWLYERLSEAMKPLGMMVYRPSDENTSKAVSKGAVHFHLDRLVSSRIIAFTYGTDGKIDYDRSDPDHITRFCENGFIGLSGRFELVNAFSAIITKGTSVRDGAEFRKTYLKESPEPDMLNRMSADIIAYRGMLANPRWTDVDPDLYVPLCTISADTSRVVKRPLHSVRGIFYAQVFDIVLLCGSTELKAQISWMENGEEKRSPATMVYDDVVADSDPTD